VTEKEARQIVFSKPERIAGFDPGLTARLRRDTANGKVALVEIAGRDSVAAGVKAASSGSYDFLVPTIVYTGTEYGDWSNVLSNARALAGRFQGGAGPRVLESNYRDLQGDIIVRDEDLSAYIDEFLVPVTSEVLSSFAAGILPDYIAVAEQFMSSIIKFRPGSPARLLNPGLERPG
jgi:hypothetical protein